MRAGGRIPATGARMKVEGRRTSDDSLFMKTHAKAACSRAGDRHGGSDQGIAGAAEIVVWPASNTFSHRRLGVEKLSRFGLRRGWAQTGTPSSNST